VTSAKIAIKFLLQV